MVYSLLYKVARRDFYYFLNLKGVARFIASLMDRVGGKILVDFTLLVHLRHPQEVGGFSLLVSILVSLAASIFLTYQYLNHYNGETKIDKETLQSVLVGVYSVWFISSVALVSTMKRQYIRTFFSFDTSRDYNSKFVLSLREDQEELKSTIFDGHPNLYAGWGDQVLKPWCLENWERWEEERPACFSE